jgi:isocitrate lyase
MSNENGTPRAQHEAAIKKATQNLQAIAKKADAEMLQAFHDNAPQEDKNQFYGTIGVVSMSLINAEAMAALLRAYLSEFEYSAIVANKEAIGTDATDHEVYATMNLVRDQLIRLVKSHFDN